MEKAKGKVKYLKKDGTAVCIEVEGIEQWFNLSKYVKPSFCRVGEECDISYELQDKGNPVLKYITCGGVKMEEVKIEKASDINKISEEMIRMNATKTASQVFAGTSEVDGFKELVKEVINFIKTGEWD